MAHWCNGGILIAATTSLKTAPVEQSTGAFILHHPEAKYFNV